MVIWKLERPVETEKNTEKLYIHAQSGRIYAIFKRKINKISRIFNRQETKRAGTL